MNICHVLAVYFNRKRKVSNAMPAGVIDVCPKKKTTEKSEQTLFTTYQNSIKTSNDNSSEEFPHKHAERPRLVHLRVFYELPRSLWQVKMCRTCKDSWVASTKLIFYKSPVNVSSAVDVVFLKTFTTFSAPPEECLNGSNLLKTSSKREKRRFKGV